MNQSEVTLYYMTGCGWCEKFKPEWKRFETDVAPRYGIKTYSIESRQMTGGDRIAGQPIRGFPSIKVKTMKGEFLYDGPRNADALAEYIKRSYSQSGGNFANNKSKYNEMLKRIYTYKIEKYTEKLNKLNE